MNLTDYSSFLVHPVLVMPQPAGENARLVIGCIATSLVLWGIIRARVNGGVILIVLAAALASCSMEAWAEYMAMNYHPEIGGHIAYTAWGMPVPVHDALSYLLYFGGPGYGFLQLAQRGRSTAFWWGFFLLVCLVVLLGDLTALHSGIWIYYGPQPFVLWGFPLTWMFCNAASMFGFAVIVHACLSSFKGVARLLTIGIAPIGLSMVWGGVCLPVANALHSTSGPAIIRLGACASIAASMFVIALSIRYLRWASGRQVIPSTQSNTVNATLARVAT